MIYLDSNIFIYACLSSNDVGERSRGLIRNVENGGVEASTSALSFDEVTWAVKRYRSIEKAVSAGEALINMPKLNLVSTDETILRSALDLMRRYAFDPRDSIHAASAIACKADALVSTDTHFDRLKELPRKEV
jgi:predicted nucleic acid-binding protein